MKTFKLAIIATILTFTVISTTNADGFKLKNNAVYLTFEKALQSPGLVIAMHQQLNSGLLTNNQQVYVFSVIYQNKHYRISGTYQQWNLFFTPKWQVKSESDPATIYED